tara:strand:- start:1717 stop:1854 length:138 start_codon:yes stop_codon:yes gene_type:complete
MGKNQDISASQRLVASNVIRMHMSVDQKSDLTIGNASNRRNQSLG